MSNQDKQPDNPRPPKLRQTDEEKERAAQNIDKLARAYAEGTFDEEWERIFPKANKANEAK
jgi:hypothetical protein